MHIEETMVSSAKSYFFLWACFMSRDFSGYAVVLLLFEVSESDRWRGGCPMAFAKEASGRH